MAVAPDALEGALQNRDWLATGGAGPARAWACAGKGRLKAAHLFRTAGLAMLLSGCVTSHVREAEVPLPPSYETQPTSFGSQTAQLDDWWTYFEDAQLDALVAEALANAPDARSALAVLAQAAATRQELLARITLPSGQLQASGTRTQTYIIDGIPAGGGQFYVQDGASANYSANFDVSWELDLFGRRGAATRGVAADFASAAFDYEASRTSLIANVATALFQSRGLALQVVEAEDTARIAQDLLALARKREAAGLGTDAEVDQAIAQAQTADAQVESLRAQLAAARRSLLVLIGHGFDATDSLPVSPSIGRPPSLPESLPGDLLRRRPDIRAAEWRIASAAAQLRLDDLALLPTIDILPGLSLRKSTGPFGTVSGAWSIGGNLTAPILDRPRLIAAIHGQRAVAEQNVIAYEKAVQTAYGDVETAVTYMRSEDRRVRMLEEAEGRARSAFAAAQEGYARGLTDQTAVLQAESTWRNAKSQLSAARVALMQRTVQAFKALGGGWSPDRPADDTPYEVEVRGSAMTAGQSE